MRKYRNNTIHKKQNSSLSYQSIVVTTIPGFKPFEPLFNFIPPTFKPITPLDPDTLTKIKPRMGSHFTGTSFSSNSYSSNVNGKVTSGGSMTKVDNINGKIKEEHITFGDAKPE